MTKLWALVQQPKHAKLTYKTIKCEMLAVSLVPNENACASTRGLSLNVRLLTLHSKRQLRRHSLLYRTESFCAQFSTV